MAQLSGSTTERLIKEHLIAIVMWLIRTDFHSVQQLTPPLYEPIPRLHRPFIVKKSFNDTIARVMALGYVAFYAADIFGEELRNELRQNIGKLDTFEPGTGDISKRAQGLGDNLLQWYFYCCREKLRSIVDAEYKSSREALQIIRNQGLLVVKLSTKETAKRSSKDSLLYSVDDEIMDRNSFLAQEIFPRLADHPGGNVCSTYAEVCVKDARNRILSRRKTSQLPSGVKKGKRNERASTPWELHLLNHHGLILAKLGDPEGTEAIEKDCFEFLSSDYSFLESWDSSDRHMLRDWWNFEPASIVCATFLDIQATKGELCTQI